MICKKCGREYEDDMPQCLWCDTPNESLSSQDECETSSADSEAQEEAYKESLKELVDPELERAFDGNVRRGKSTISWTKFQMVLNVIFFFVEVKTFGAIAAFYGSYKENAPIPREVNLAVWTLIVFFMASAIPFCVFIGKNLLWIYHAHKEQNKFSETQFSPWGVTICYYLPIANYFIFKTLIDNQYDTLKSMGIKAQAVPNKLLTWFLLFNIATPIFNYICLRNFNTPVLFISTVLWFILTILYIKLIRVATANEQAVHDQLENNRINKKVEEIIAQRDVNQQNTEQT
ncbi:hypothetical protein [Fibrobacter sp. UWB11]|uniref:hypothetical protein n=1 Tax=Fibrobacter sp. UWB11 TaxID=1896202 RepID=UPI00092C41E9|nr:hypothetical protein [Fibrobacter sp. UWB11]SIN86788.1 hypothetical protein SAMN05720758_0321 [Fibrobacter sp. UWB11]